MKSDDIGFSGWAKWPVVFLDQVPETPGVYLFRLGGGTIPRVKGESDIVYVGSTARKLGTLRQRLGNHKRDYQSGKSLLLRIRNERGEIELAWQSFRTHDQALYKESRLLDEYLRQHLELPPLNHQQSSLKLYKKLRLFLDKDGSVPDEKKDLVWTQWTETLGWIEKEKG